MINRDNDLKHSIFILSKAFSIDAPFFNQIHQGQYSQEDVHFYFERYVGWIKDSLEWTATDKGALFWIKAGHENPFGKTKLKCKFLWDYLRHYGPAVTLRLIKVSLAFTKFKKVAPKEAWEIYTFGVLPEYQGQGIGTDLFTQSMDKLDSYKKPYFLFTQYQRNIKLYEKFGFKVIYQESIGENTGYSMLRTLT